MRLIAALAVAGVPGVGSDARAQTAGAKTVATLPTDGSNVVARPFGNKDIASEKIGREPVLCVSNIGKSDVASTLVVEDEEARRKAIGELEKKVS